MKLWSARWAKSWSKIAGVVLIGGGLVSSGPAQAQFARLRQKYAAAA